MQIDRVTKIRNNTLNIQNTFPCPGKKVSCKQQQKHTAHYLSHEKNCAICNSKRFLWSFSHLLETYAVENSKRLQFTFSPTKRKLCCTQQQNLTVLFLRPCEKSELKAMAKSYASLSSPGRKVCCEPQWTLKVCFHLPGKKNKL